MQLKQRISMVAALVLGAGVISPVVAGPAVAATSPADRTVQQIEALSHAKAARTATEQKVDSRLLTEVAKSSGATAAVKAVQTGVTVSHGRVSLDVEGSMTGGVLDRIRALGGAVQHRSLKAGTARVELPLDQIMKTAALPQVSHIAPAVGAMTASMRGPGARSALTTPSKEQRQARVAKSLRSALSANRRSSGVATAAGPGSVESEAVQVHAVDTARAQFGVSGVGVKVGVLSDGVDSLATSQSTGDLPPDVEVLPGQAGFGDEGTAMLELVHDIAPGADLAFATANDSEESFAANIEALRAAGADIIVDDVIYFDESPFQDGPVAQAVNAVTADGALYFSSAGNEGNKDDGTSGTWEGDFASSGKSLPKIVGKMHDFKPGGGVQTQDPVSDLSIGAPVDLFWADPLGKAKDDYDVYIVDEQGSVKAFSNNVQNGSQDPYELTFVPFPDHDGQVFSVVVVKFKGANRFLHLDVLRGRFVNVPGLKGFSTPGELRGHAAAADAYAVAAVPAADPLPFDLEPGDPPNPSGPFPGVFTASQLSERFTSDGPRRMFFKPDGKPYKPGKFTSKGGIVRQKPNITAADGVSNSVAGFSPFFGTSAAAPDAAAIVALVLSGNPGIAPATVRSAVTSTALDIEAHGTDRDTGAGIIMADRLLSKTGATPQPLAEAGDPVLGTSTDGDSFLEPGESAPLDVPVTNNGDGPAAQVEVTLSTSAPGVVITPATRAYGTIAKGATVSSPQPWTITLPADYPLGRPVDIEASVAFAGAYSPTSRTLSVPTGEPSTDVTDVAYTGPPVPIPDGDFVGATVPLDVTGVGTVSRVTFSVDGTACSTVEGSTTVGIDHTFVNDLVASLTSPSGTSIAVFAFIASDGNNICQAVFDDTAARSIDDATANEAPFTGSWRPTEPLSTFVGEDGDGTWSFNVVDAATLDTGSIRAVSLHLSGYVTPGP